MTDFLSDVASLANAGASRQFTPPYSDGNMNWKWASLSAAHGYTIAQSDQVIMFTLPKNSRPVLIASKFGAFGASVVLDAGATGSTQLFEAGLDVSAAGTSLTMVDNPTPLTDVTTVQVLLRGANPADDQEVQVGIGYVNE